MKGFLTVTVKGIGKDEVLIEPQGDVHLRLHAALQVDHTVETEIQHLALLREARSV